MDDLLREYARLTPLAHLQFPAAPPGAFNRVHDVLLNKVLLDQHLCSYPPAPEYQLKFWKWAIRGLDHLLGDEVNPRVFVWSCPLILKHHVGHRNRRKDIQSSGGADSVHFELPTSDGKPGSPFAIICYPLSATVPRISECDPTHNITRVSHDNRAGNYWTQDLAGRLLLSGVVRKTPRFSRAIHFPHQGP